ncbi:MAG: hypothetical protein AAFR62_06565 [Cyanobacteria bacterium J06629_2]
MNQENQPSKLEAKLSANAIDAVAQAFNLGMSSKELQEFKDRTVKDAQSVTNEWALDLSKSNTTTDD